MTLCWLRGPRAEAVRLRLLNDALRREGKLCGAAVTPLPRWRAHALRGAGPDTPIAICEQASLAPMQSTDGENHVLFLTVPESMFHPRSYT